MITTTAKLTLPTFHLFSHPANLLLKTAFIDSTGKFSYKNYFSALHKTTHAVKIHKTTAFLFPRDFSFVVVQSSIWAAKAMAVPLCTSHPPHELHYSIQESESTLVLYHNSFQQKIQSVQNEFDCSGISFKSFDSDFFNAEYDVQIHFEDFDQDLPAQIIFTSGTTGRPKGVVSTFRNITSQIESLQISWRWSENDVILLVLPLHHIHGNINVLGCCIASGATCVFGPEKFNPEWVWEQIAEGGVTLFMAVPTIYSKLLSYIKSQSTRYDIKSICSAVRLMVSGSSALPTPLFEEWFEYTGVQLLERYGMTEIGMGLGNPIDGKRIAGEVGKPFPNISCKIINEDGENVTYPGGIGELYFNGVQVFKEYYNRPLETSAVFVNGWFKTGDLATMTAHETFRILGRNSVDIIKSGGFKLSALQIEREILSLSEISEVAVIGVPDDVWGEIVCAIFVSDIRNLDIPNIRKALQSKLAPYEIPSVWKQVEEIPKNVMGKINKKEMKKALMLCLSDDCIYISLHTFIHCHYQSTFLNSSSDSDPQNYSEPMSISLANFRSMTPIHSYNTNEKIYSLSYFDSLLLISTSSRIMIFHHDLVLFSSFSLPIDTIPDNIQLSSSVYIPQSSRVLELNYSGVLTHMYCYPSFVEHTYISGLKIYSCTQTQVYIHCLTTHELLYTLECNNVYGAVVGRDLLYTMTPNEIITWDVHNHAILRRLVIENCLGVYVCAGRLLSVGQVIVEWDVKGAKRNREWRVDGGIGWSVCNGVLWWLCNDSIKWLDVTKTDPDIAHGIPRKVSINFAAVGQKNSLPNLKISQDIELQTLKSNLKRATMLLHTQHSHKQQLKSNLDETKNLLQLRNEILSQTKLELNTTYSHLDSVNCQLNTVMSAHLVALDYIFDNVEISLNESRSTIRDLNSLLGPLSPLSRVESEDYRSIVKPSRVWIYDDDWDSDYEVENGDCWWRFPNSSANPQEMLQQSLATIPRKLRDQELESIEWKGKVKPRKNDFESIVYNGPVKTPKKSSASSKTRSEASSSTSPISPIKGEFVTNFEDVDSIIWHGAVKSKRFAKTGIPSPPNTPISGYNKKGIPNVTHSNNVLFPEADQVRTSQELNENKKKKSWLTNMLHIFKNEQ